MKTSTILKEKYITANSITLKKYRRTNNIFTNKEYLGSKQSLPKTNGKGTKWSRKLTLHLNWYWIVFKIFYWTSMNLIATDLHSSYCYNIGIDALSIMHYLLHYHCIYLISMSLWWNKRDWLIDYLLKISWIDAMIFQLHQMCLYLECIHCQDKRENMHRNYVVFVWWLSFLISSYSF